jgi:hypothetical protein
LYLPVPSIDSSLYPGALTWTCDGSEADEALPPGAHSDYDGQVATIVASLGRQALVCGIRTRGRQALAACVSVPLPPVLPRFAKRLVITGAYEEIIHKLMFE